MTKGEAELVFVPLGGVGEIGMNFALYGVGQGRKRQWLAVDCGVGFANDQLPGIDLMLPDIRFIEEERKNLLGIVISHGHEDHIGALADLWPRLRVPVYTTPFTAQLITVRRLQEPGAPDIPLEIVPVGGHVSLGPFEIDFIPVAHSIPESHALAIRTPHGTVLHTGDWKIDPTPVAGGITDEARFRALGDAGVLAMVADSTNSVREGRSPSEADAGANLAKVIAEAKGRVAVTTFASNVARMVSVAKAAEAAGREVVLVGRAMERVSMVARELGYLDGVREFRSVDTYGYLPRDKVVALITGSQGEPRAALSRIALDEHPDIALSPGDTVVFSARAIPGNEVGIGRITNALIRQGVEVITDRTHMIHVSGHPRRGEMADMLRWVRPRILVPVHGEALHMHEHAALAKEIGIPEVVRCGNGDVVRLAPGAAGVIDEVPAWMGVKDTVAVTVVEPAGDQRAARPVGPASGTGPIGRTDFNSGGAGNRRRTVAGGDTGPASAHHPARDGRGCGAAWFPWPDGRGRLASSSRCVQLEPRPITSHWPTAQAIRSPCRPAQAGMNIGDRAWA
ncbi:MAG: ribonuclease J [Blastochloris sp.]|nr:ribonuclease J [Blastochloris sp.]